MKIVIDNILLNPGVSESVLKNQISSKLGIDFKYDIKIARRSLDARNKKRIVYRYRIIAAVPDSIAEDLIHHDDVSVFREADVRAVNFNLDGLRAVIVGAGPSGLFCALRLIELGAYVEIIERGKPVGERTRDVNLLKKNGILKVDSNILFGEGGAGAYSDGKLYTGIKRPEALWFIRKMVEYGAPESIQYDAKPHVGTDRLVKIIRNIRNRIISSGSKIFYNERFVEIIKSGNRINGIITSAGKEFRSHNVILAAGHSARDTYEVLAGNGIEIEKKGFAVGIRVEHPADLINRIQYGSGAQVNVLPAAEYKLAYNNRKTGRGVYSFCMCPGGEIINSSSEPGGLCTNGMSYSGRDMPYSNSAIVVTVGVDDLGKDPLSGLVFQKRIEEAAFLAGGENFIAPAQTISSFLEDRLDDSIRDVSYLPGVKPSLVSSYLPSWIIDEIKAGLYSFERKMKGYISDKGVIVGAETRTSSPVRIIRDDNLCSVSLDGFFPIGEGSGYSGGIVSSAVDGIRAADKIAKIYNEKRT